MTTTQPVLASAGSGGESCSVERPSGLQWVGEVLRGDFGESFFSNREISDALRHRLPVTFQLGAMAMVLSALVAVPIGVFSAIWQDSYLDYALRSFAVALIALPSFWLGLIAIVFGFQWFGWVPPIRFEYLWDDSARQLADPLGAHADPRGRAAEAGRPSAAPPRRHRR